nr:unnamed protein product [Digitaria exilis]
MAMEDPPAPAPAPTRQSEAGAGGRRTDKHGRRLEVYNEVLARLRSSAAAEISPAFEDALWAHFHRLPARYALDVNAERADDVLTHQRLLEEARDPERRPAMSVRVVQVSRLIDGDADDSFDPDMETAASNHSPSQLVHPPPAFGSSSNLEALGLETSEGDVRSTNDTDHSVHLISRPMHEITFATVDKPKLLSQLTCLLAELGLDIQEAHAFSTIDGYSLDVFVVTGWHLEDVAIKVVRPERISADMYRDFAQEVYIMSIKDLKS